MNRSTLLVRLVVPGPPATGNPRSGGLGGHRSRYRQGVEAAVRGLLVGSAIPDGPVAISINVVMKRGRRGDVDNIAKSTLDALGDLLGKDLYGRTDDDRVWMLLVTKTFVDEGLESVTIEVHRYAPEPVHIL